MILRLQRSPGFTLIELLVVISIVALLISLLLPALRSAREQAKTLQCLANQRSIVMAFNVYSVDNRSIMPGGANAGINSVLPFWSNALITSNLIPRNSDTNDVVISRRVQCPNNKAVFSWWNTYAVPFGSSGKRCAGGEMGSQAFTRLEQVMKPSMTPHLVELYGGVAGGVGWYSIQNGTIVDGHPFRHFEDIHNDSSNLAMVDGRAKTVPASLFRNAGFLFGPAFAIDLVNYSY